MKEYIVVGRTMQESMSVFDYLLTLLHDKIERCNKIGRTVVIGDYILTFSCQELYDRYVRFANHAEVIPAYLLERRLDMYRTFIADKKKEKQ